MGFIIPYLGIFIESENRLFAAAQNRDPGSPKNANSSGVDSRPRMTLRWAPAFSNHWVADLSGFPTLGGQLQALHGQLLACVRGGLLEREINACLFAQGLGGFVGA
jgi:hypothetical protein